MVTHPPADFKRSYLTKRSDGLQVGFGPQSQRVDTFASYQIPILAIPWRATSHVILVNAGIQIT